MQESLHQPTEEMAWHVEDRCSVEAVFLLLILTV